MGPVTLEYVSTSATNFLTQKPKLVIELLELGTEYRSLEKLCSKCPVLLKLLLSGCLPLDTELFERNRLGFLSGRAEYKDVELVRRVLRIVVP